MDSPRSRNVCRTKTVAVLSFGDNDLLVVAIALGSDDADGLPVGHAVGPRSLSPRKRTLIHSMTEFTQKANARRTGFRTASTTSWIESTVRLLLIAPSRGIWLLTKSVTRCGLQAMKVEPASWPAPMPIDAAADRLATVLPRGSSVVAEIGVTTLWHTSSLKIQSDQRGRIPQVDRLT